MPPDADTHADRVAELFHEVVDLDAAQRRALYEQRAVAAAVCDEVEALLGEEPLAAFAEDALSSAGRRLVDLSQPVRAWEEGTAVGDYRIVREVARGGMGIVYEAEQRSLARRVALKVVRDSCFADEAERQRFRTEAEAIARLEHSGIVPVYEVGQHDGQPFYSMAYLGGGSLKELSVPVEPARAAELVVQVCDAIHYAHTQNIVHRDLKPANVLLSDKQEPRVSDFGLAKNTSEESDLTHTGAILGTPSFMAPEQASGSNDAVGHLADVYGLGGVLYYLLTGHAPIEGATLVETLHKVIHEDVVDPRRHVATVPADLVSICRKALEKEPIRRYGSAASLAADLRRYLAGEPTEARPLRAAQRSWRWCRRRPALAGLATIAILAVLGGGISSYLFALDASDKAASLAALNTDLEQSNRELLAARDRAQDARRSADAFAKFLIEDVVQSARPKGKGGGIGADATVRDALLAAIPMVAVRFGADKLEESFARHELGVTLRHTGALDEAIEQLELAVATRRPLVDASERRLLKMTNSLATAYYMQGRFDDAVKVFVEIDALTGEHDPALHLLVLKNLAACYHQLERNDANMATLARAVECATSRYDRLHLSARLAAACAIGDQRQRAVELAAEARAAIDAGTFSSASESLTVQLALVRAYDALQDRDELVAFLPGVIDDAYDVLSATSVETIWCVDLLVELLIDRERLADAAEVLHRQFDAERRVDGDRLLEHGELLARLYMLTESYDLAIDTARFVRDRLLAVRAADEDAFRLDVLVAQLLVVSRRRPEAVDLLRSRIDQLRAQVRAGDGGELPEHLRQFERLLRALDRK